MCPEAKLRKLVRNMIYDGVVARLLDIELPKSTRRSSSSSPRKAKAAELNWRRVKAGYEYAAANLTKPDPYFVERMNETAGQDHHRRQRRLRPGLHVRRRDRGRPGIRSRRPRRWSRA